MKSVPKSKFLTEVKKLLTRKSKHRGWRSYYTPEERELLVIFMNESFSYGLLPSDIQREYGIDVQKIDTNLRRWGYRKVYHYAKGSISKALLFERALELENINHRLLKIAEEHAMGVNPARLLVLRKEKNYLTERKSELEKTHGFTDAHLEDIQEEGSYKHYREEEGKLS